MKALEELRRHDPAWYEALDRLVRDLSEHLVSQRIGGLVGRADVALNWGAGSSKAPLKIEFKPVKVIQS